MRLRYGKWTVIEVETVIGTVGFLGYLAVALIWGWFSPEALGLVLGILGAMALFLSMAVSLETALDIGHRDGTKRHTKKMMILRYTVIVVITGALSRTDRINVVSGLLALLFSLKLGLFFQPYVHLLFCKWFQLKDELSPDALYLPEEEKDSDEEDDGDEDKPDRIDRWLGRIYGK